MTENRQSLDAAERCLAEAARWRICLTEIGAQTLPEFEAWLTDPDNRQAWLQVSAPWTYIGRHAHAPELIAARQAALGDAKRAGDEPVSPWFLRRSLVAAAACIVLGLVVWGGVLWANRPDDYRTAIGERRIVTLSDGSKLSLDADSEVTVRYGKNARSLHLLKGQARFDVAHDVERPFSVIAGNQKVIATGTAFNIDMSGPKVLVTLIEGHVVVVNEDGREGMVAMPRPLWPRVVELHAGQQLKAAPAAPPAIETANIQRVTAWTNGQIIFDNEPLSSVVARVNRYGGAGVKIGDPEVGAMRISGVLNAGDVAGFVDIVTHYLPVRAVAQDDNSIVLESGPKRS